MRNGKAIKFKLPIKLGGDKMSLCGVNKGRFLESEVLWSNVLLFDVRFHIPIGVRRLM